MFYIVDDVLRSKPPVVWKRTIEQKIALCSDEIYFRLAVESYNNGRGKKLSRPNIVKYILVKYNRILIVDCENINRTQCLLPHIGRSPTLATKL